MRKAVLCVDDEAILLLAITMSLRNLLPKEVHVDASISAAEAFEAIDELAARGIDVGVVVCDLLMPGMKGDDFLRALHSKRPEIKSILLTGFAGSSEEAELRRDIGLYASLIKPCNNGDLARLIKEALG